MRRRRRLLSSRPKDERRRRDNNGPSPHSPSRSLTSSVGRFVGFFKRSRKTSKTLSLLPWKPRARPLHRRRPDRRTALDTLSGRFKARWTGSLLSGPTASAVPRITTTVAPRGLNVVTTDFRPIETRMAQFRGSGWPFAADPEVSPPRR